MHPFISPLHAFLYWETTKPDKIFLKQPHRGIWKDYTYFQAGQEIRKIARAIKELQLPPRSHIALLSKNCAHWNMADLAIMLSGHVSIPIYPTLHARAIGQILEHSESKAIILGKLDDFGLQRQGIPDIPKISVNTYGIHQGKSWERLVETNDPITELPEIDKEDLITIIYTSGTTGTPKGVMHSVGNFMECAYTLKAIFPAPENLRLFSYLPLAHIAERIGMATYGLLQGATIYFPESLDTFASDLERTQPHIFFAVPRIWVKFKEKINQVIPQKKLNLLLQIPLINTLIKKKLRKKLGLRDAVFVCSAAAPLAVRVMEWFQQLGIQIHQGYGMTEDCVISHFNLPDASRLGTVGKPLPNVEIKLSPKGEICIKNKCLMKGYYKNPELTSEVFDSEGFLRTGDVGEYDHDGYLYITGRVKDQFKTDKGKYIDPAPIELQLERDNFIEQVCIVGTGIPQPIALITLSETGKNKDITTLKHRFSLLIDEINPDLEKHERLEKIVIMKEEWTIANGLCTPTLKVKRNQIEKLHQPIYKSWFLDSERIIFE